MRSIILNQEMVRAYAEGRKDVTRVPMKRQPPSGHHFVKMSADLGYPASKGFAWAGFEYRPDNPDPIYFKAPLTPGERIYIRETWATSLYMDDRPPRETKDHGLPFCYMDGSVKFTGATTGGPSFTTMGKWRPSIHMPEWAARFRPTVISIRPERIQDITRIEAIREGVMAYPLSSYMEGGVRPDQTAADVYFRELWDRLYPGSWERNEWVWRREITKPEGV